MSSNTNKKKRKIEHISNEEEDDVQAAKIIKLTDLTNTDEESEDLPNSPIEKSDKETMTEEDYLTDLEKIYKNYKENYKELEVEEYKQMLQKFYNQNLRLATRCQKLKAAVEKTQTTTTKILREISKQVNPHQLSLISAQLINHGKPPKKRVFSPQLKNVVVGLYQVSPAAYRYLSSILILPEEEEVNQWISQGLQSDLVDEKVKKVDSSRELAIGAEAQAVLDAIAFENLMATLL